MTETETEQATRRTKRRYAHELYPYAEEGEVRPLAVEVPYLYARMVGSDMWGTGWFALTDPGRSNDDLRQVGDRTHLFATAKHMALLADALHQGLTGDAAWDWAGQRQCEVENELAYERALHYGVPVEQIKPYPCGPEPDHHDHWGAADARGGRLGTHVDGKESDCPDCTEEIPAETPAETAS